MAEPNQDTSLKQHFLLARKTANLSSIPTSTLP